MVFTLSINLEIFDYIMVYALCKTVSSVSSANHNTYQLLFWSFSEHKFLKKKKTHVAEVPYGCLIVKLWLTIENFRIIQVEKNIFCLPIFRFMKVLFIYHRLYMIHSILSTSQCWNSKKLEFNRAVPLSYNY